ncbi:hypothetical protein HMPREF6485_1013 [Segatella buccae ATCC 33574]|uniref:Uncharacterized protein n=1 Tax=Segatella buccae ATCC 33574 TaxID=873513 RepID=E6K607_9BACT|nr:hypothetical protein HMPREF6485_1013 [Segatella buccae ATCC 33574]
MVQGSCTIRAEAMHHRCNSQARGVQEPCTAMSAGQRLWQYRMWNK